MRPNNRAAESLIRDNLIGDCEGYKELIQVGPIWSSEAGLFQRRTFVRLQGRVAIITGGTSGLGCAMVERFAEEGATVFFTGRREVLGDEIAKKTGATYIKADATKEEDAMRTIALAVKSNGRVDVLVNNANVPSGGGPLEAASMAMFDLAMAYVRGAYAHIKHVSPLMPAQMQGSIINISSVTAHRASAMSSYAMAKAAILHLTCCAAADLGMKNVRVNSISPGFIATGLYGKSFGLPADAADATNERVADVLSKTQPIPRAGRPADIANAALYLASDEASFVNGSDIVVDGGLMCRPLSESVAAFQAMAKLFQ